MIPTPEEAWELLCEYNQGEFHRKHGRIVGDVLRWYATDRIDWLCCIDAAIQKRQ